MGVPTIRVNAGIGMSGFCLETRLSHFLFQYWITPPTNPQLLSHWLRLHLDLLYPDLASGVEHKPELRRKVMTNISRHAKLFLMMLYLCVTLLKETLSLLELLYSLLSLYFYAVVVTYIFNASLYVVMYHQLYTCNLYNTLYNCSTES